MADGGPFWWGMYEAVRTYAAEHHGMPADDAVVGGSAVGPWVRMQRRAAMDGCLTHLQTTLLGSIPGWAWDRNGTAWRATYGALTQYIAAFQKLPVKATAYLGYNIGMWAQYQRSEHRRAALPRDRVVLLEALPGWSWTFCRDGAWRATYETLRDYIAEHHRLPPGAAQRAGHHIGEWMLNQRYLYRTHTLAPGRVAALEALPGWVWHKSGAAWHAKFEATQAFCAAHQQLPGARTQHGDHNVGAWVDAQRRAHKAGTLAPDRAALLETLPGWRWTQGPVRPYYRAQALPALLPPPAALPPPPPAALPPPAMSLSPLPPPAGRWASSLPGLPQVEWSWDPALIVGPEDAADAAGEWGQLDLGWVDHPSGLADGSPTKKRRRA